MRRVFFLLVLSVVVWAWCGAIMGIGIAVTSVETTLIVHLIGAPLGGALAAWLFQRRIGGVAPVAVAATFVGTALALDFFLVAMVIMKSYEMFTLMGVWAPLALIFGFGWLAGTRATAGTPPS